MINPLSLQNKTVIITGASGQLGYFYTKELLSLNAKVLAIDLAISNDLRNLENSFADCIVCLEVDILDKSKLNNALGVCIQNLGNPDVLINNAALDSPPTEFGKGSGLFEDYSEELWDKVIDVNLKGTFLTCQVFGSNMAKNKGGSIINVSSIYGVVSPDQSLYEYKRVKGDNFYKPSAYSASKSGIINFTRYLAVYWGKQNVRVNSLVLAGVFNNQDQEFLDVYTSRIPIGRMADPEDYIGAIIFLASDASRYMTGSSLTVDGGWTAI